MARTVGMKGRELRVGDVIWKDAIRWRILNLPYPETLTNGVRRWVVLAAPLDNNALPGLYNRALFVLPDHMEWHVEF